MNTTICSIYEKRPEICQIFPTCESDVAKFESCGYYFKEGKRYGECNGCGECCIKMPWSEDSTIENCTLDKELKADLDFCIRKDNICRFLIET